MTRIQRFLFALLVLSGILMAMSARVCAQAQPTLSKRPAAKPAGSSAASSSSSPKAVLPTEDTVNSFLFQMFGYDPTISWKVGDIKPSELEGMAEVDVIITGPQGSNANRLLVSSDGKHAVSGEVLPFGAKPFEDARVKLEKGVNGTARGPDKAAVIIVEFSDMQCPHCAKAAPGIGELLAQEPDAHFVFQNFPLPSHNWAEKAADYVDCVGRASKDGVWKFIEKAFADQTNITESNVDEKLKGIAASAGLNADEVAACAGKPETKARIEASVALGKAVGVNGTPTLFINGRSVSGGAPVDVLKKIVDFEASQEKASEEKSAK